MKRKLVSLLIVGAMAFGLMSCGKTFDSSESAPANAEAEAEAAAESGAVYKVGIIQYVDDASLNQISL